MAQPWEKYQELLKQQNRTLSRSDFLDSDTSSDSESSKDIIDPQPSTSSGIRHSTGLGRAHVEEQDDTSDSEISDLSSTYGANDPAIQHFHKVTRNINQKFLPVDSLTMPSKKRGNSQPDTSEPFQKKKKKMHEKVNGIDVHVVRAHHRQEKQFGFLVS